ncbi:flippase [Vibrio sp. 10N.247.311.59]|uniref:flippase n=1 Tax=Vibrio sp. 10N.247.311.59 TaxID=3229989 RepID=UPI00354FB747
MNFKKLTIRYIGTASTQLIGKALSLIIGVILARTLGPEQFGVYAVIMSLLSVICIPSSAGLPQLLIKTISSKYASKEFQEIRGILNWSLIYISIASVVSILIVYILQQFSLFEPSVNDVLIVGLLLVPLRGFITRFIGVLNGLNKPVKSQVVNSVIIQSLLICMIYASLKMDFKITSLTILSMNVGATIIGIFIYYFIYRSSIDSRVFCANPKYKISKWQSSLVPFTLLVVIGTLNTELATLILSHFGSLSEVGYFKVGLQCVSLLTIGLGAINNVLAPTISRNFSTGDTLAVQQQLTQSVWLTSLIAFPAVFVLSVWGDFIINLLFGTEYSESKDILLILLFGQLFNVLMGSPGLVLQMTGNERFALKNLTITLILTLFVMLILIPKYSAVGAAISVTVSIIILNVLSSYDAYVKTGLKTYFRFKI